MLQQYVENWWAFLLRGIVGIIFGLLLIFWPLMSGLALVFVLGIFAMVDGIIAVVGSIMNRKQFDRWWVILLQGIIGILFGLIAVFNPVIAGLAIIWVIAAWAIVIGILGVWAGISLRKEIQGEFWLILVSALFIIFGIVAFMNPEAAGGFLLVVWGIIALVGGIISVILAFKLRGLRGQFSEGTPATV
jgi:uncharacterized membrane protein HdeD (DUF308 family)